MFQTLWAHKMAIPPTNANPPRMRYGTQLCSDRYSECLYSNGRMVRPTNQPIDAPAMEQKATSVKHLYTNLIFLDLCFQLSTQICHQRCTAFQKVSAQKLGKSQHNHICQLHHKSPLLINTKKNRIFQGVIWEKLFIIIFDIYFNPGSLEYQLDWLFKLLKKAVYLGKDVLE